nr:diguanylate cyclase [uncultured Sulfurimonas sp.]
MKVKISIVFACIVIVTGMFYKYLKISEDEVIQNVANKNLIEIDIAYKSILDTYLLVAKKHFYDLGKNEKALELLFKFKYADAKDKPLIRGEFFRLLYRDYEVLTEYNIRQFHFHTHDAKSLLRFHLPYYSGDSLKDIRTSVRVANSEFKIMSGFEGGKVFPGYRYVFPIINKGEHLGSVEFSISFDGIERKLKTILPFEAHEIIMSKAVTYDKVFKDYRDFFVQSLFSKDYYLENSEISRVTEKVEDNPLVNRLSLLAKESKNFDKKLQQKKSFSIPVTVQNRGYVVTFMAFKDIDGIDAGYIVSYAKLQEIVEIQNRYKNIMFAGFFIAALLFALIIIILFQIKENQEYTLKLKKFIDIQDSIVILTDGKKFKFANKKFFDFLQYADIDDFLSKHSCICDLFIYNENFFSLANVKAGEKNWVESLLNLSGRNRIVSMLDKTSMPHAFTVSINKYDKVDYIINFSDISDAMSEKLQLQKQISRDQLTKAYNRVYFEKNIDLLMAHNASEKRGTGVIFFDIDFFKDVNDTYGHKVGDDILVTIVDIVKKNIRIGEQLIRWGGEEFLIILPANSIDEIYKEAEKLRKIIEKHDFEIVHKLTCSFGVTLHEEHTSINESIIKADEKLYEAKKSGRNRVVFSFT